MALASVTKYNWSGPPPGPKLVALAPKQLICQAHGKRHHAPGQELDRAHNLGFAPFSVCHEGVLPASRHKSCYIYCSTDHAGTRSPRRTPGVGCTKYNSVLCPPACRACHADCSPRPRARRGALDDVRHSARQARPHPSRQPLHFASVMFDQARGKKETATA